jgi:hypothetical protein
VPPAVPPRRPRPARWLVALAGIGGLLFTVGLLVQVRCAVGECPASVARRLFDLQARGSLPRLFTTAVFVLVGLLAGLASARMHGRVRLWWSLVGAGGVVLAVAKAVSAHSTAEQDGGAPSTLAGGVALSVVALSILLWAGLRWSVPGAVPVSAALAAYAVAALGLDQVTGAVGSVWEDPTLRAWAVFLEEGGEAGTALVLLATVVQAVRRPVVGRGEAQS